MEQTNFGKTGMVLGLACLTLAAGCSKEFALAPATQPSYPSTTTPTVAASQSPTATPTVAVAQSLTSTPTATATSSFTPRPSATPTETFTPTATFTATNTSTATSTPTVTSTPTPIPAPWVVTGTTDNFNQEVLQAPVPVLVVFGATWCGACQIMDPAAQQFAIDEAGKVKVVFVDYDTQSALFGTYNISGLPTCIFFKNGAQTSQESVGSYPTSAEDEAMLITMLSQI